MDRAVLPLAQALTLIAISKVASAGIAMYAFLRVRALHPLAALMGATSFMFSGLLVVWLQWSYASTLIFFPLLFAAVEWLRTRDGGRPMAILALVVAFDAFAGYPQVFLLGLASAGAWALYRARGAARASWSGAASRWPWAFSWPRFSSCLSSSIRDIVPSGLSVRMVAAAARVAPVGRQPSDAVLLWQPDRP